MNAKARVFQEIVYLSDNAIPDIDEIATFIDSEIALERMDKDGTPIKIDSVSIVDDETQIHFPYAHSGEEFRSFVRNISKFNRLK